MLDFNIAMWTATIKNGQGALIMNDRQHQRPIRGQERGRWVLFGSPCVQRMKIKQQSSRFVAALKRIKKKKTANIDMYFLLVAQYRFVGLQQKITTMKERYCT